MNRAARRRGEKPVANFNGNIPDLGPKPQVRAGVQFHALVRKLDELGTTEAKMVQGPNGPMAQVTRDSYFDAEEFIEAILQDLLPAVRAIVREELAVFFERERERA